MVYPRYDDDIKPSFSLDSYEEEDVLQKRVYYPHEIDITALPTEITQNFYNIQSWLESVDIVGPKVIIEREEVNGNYKLKISVMKGNPQAIDYFFGKDESQLILVIPNCYNISNLQLNIDGTTELQWYTYAAAKVAFQILAGQQGELLVDVLTGWLTDKLLELGISWGTAFLKPPLEYDTEELDSFTVLAVDFDSDGLGQDFVTFDEFDISFEIISNGCSEPISMISDLRYVWSINACPRFYNSPITGTTAECGFQRQEFRIWVTIKWPTDIQEINSPELPKEFALSQNYPNPFNPETKIEFSLPRTSFVTIEVFNILGQRVRTLVNERLSAGYKAVTWDGRDDNGQSVSSGVYFYRIVADDFAEGKKMILLK